jgi:hypothetical protein
MGFEKTEAEKITNVPKKKGRAKVNVVESQLGDVRRRGRCGFAKTLGWEETHLAQKCDCYLS